MHNPIVAWDTHDFASAATAARSCCSNVIEFGLSSTIRRVRSVSACSKFAASVPSTKVVATPKRPSRSCSTARVQLYGRATQTT